MQWFSLLAFPIISARVVVVFVNGPLTIRGTGWPAQVIVKICDDSEIGNDFLLFKTKFVFFIYLQFCFHSELQ